MYETRLEVGEGETLIDLRSDTLTQPSESMRRAMAEAQVGDDVFGEDPTVNALEDKCSKLFGTEEALFVASGAMGNLISLLVHCSNRGSEIIIGEQSHIHKYEQGSYAEFGGISATILPNAEDGTIDLEAVERSIRNHHDVHQPKTQVICLENTSNRCGGRILPLKYLSNTRSLANKYDIKVHMDGARLMNASVGSGVEVKDIVKYVDSVSMCLSKGVGAPVGSVIGGTRDFIANAKRMRKALGGGWRQAGVLAAAGIVGLDSAPNHIQTDHDNARRLAQGIGALKSDLCTVANKVETNIVQLKTSIPANHIVDMLKEREKGHATVAVLNPENDMIRIVTNWNVNADAIDAAVHKFAHVLSRCAAMERKPPKT